MYTLTPASKFDLPEPLLRNIFLMLDSWKSVECVNHDWRRIALDIKHEWRLDREAKGLTGAANPTPRTCARGLRVDLPEHPLCSDVATTRPEALLADRAVLLANATLFTGIAAVLAVNA